MSLIKRLLLGLVLAIVAGLALPAAAHAAPPVNAAPVIFTEPAICSAPNASEADKLSAGCSGMWVPAASRLYLPVDRWGSVATGLHTRGGDGVLTDLTTKIQRSGTFPMYMGAGNAMYSMSSSMVTGALSFDVLTWVGQPMDNLVGTFGKAIQKSGLLVLGVVVALITALYGAYRGRGGGASFKRLGHVVVLVAILSILVTGATKSTGSAGDSYRPGKGSPGWFATTANSVISAVASAPAAALTVDYGSMLGMSSQVDKNAGIMTCEGYVKVLNDRYIESGGGAINVAKKSESSVPLIISRMWEQTGLRAWTTSQFGADNPLGDAVYCRLLEERAGIPASTQIGINNSGAKSKAPKAEALSGAWGTGGESDPRDRSMVAWAACRVDDSGKWFVHPEWKKVSRSSGFLGAGGKSTIDVGDCENWWNDKFFTDDGINGILTRDTSALDFNGKASDNISDTRETPEVRDFLLHLHGAGANTAGNILMAIVYAFSALIVLVVFAVLSLAILGAKMVMAVSIFFLVIAIIRDIFVGDFSGSGKVVRQYLGMAFVVFGMTFILALIALFTGLLTSAAATSFGGGSVMAMVWTGIAPIASLIVVHLIFTKIFKVPSPLSINGASAWGKAAASGSIGGAVAAGVGGRMASRAGHAATRAASSGMRNLAHNAGRGRGGAPHTARQGSALHKSTAQTGAGIQTATSAATGAAAGAAVTGAQRPGGRIPAPKRDGKATTDAPEMTSASKPQLTPTQRQAAKAAERQTLEQRAQRDGTSVTGARIAQAIEGKQTQRAVKEVERNLERGKLHDERIDRRGYDGGLLGNVREALTERMGEKVETLKARPVRTVAVAAGKTMALTAGTVATGGLLLPIAGAVAAKRGVGNTIGAQRRSVDNYRRIQQAAREQNEREAIERARKSKDESEARRPSRKPLVMPESTPKPAAVEAPARVARRGTATAAGRRSSIAPPRSRVASGTRVPATASKKVSGATPKASIVAPPRKNSRPQTDNTEW